MEYRAVLNDGRILTPDDKIKNGVWDLCPLCNARILRSFGSLDSMMNHKGDHGIVESFADSICQECAIKYDASRERRWGERDGTFTEWKCVDG